MNINLLTDSTYQFYLLTPIGANISLPAPQYTAHIGDGFTITPTL